MSNSSKLSKTSRIRREKHGDLWDEIRARTQGGLGYFSARACTETRGRRAPETDDHPARPPFARDKQRLLYTPQFARYFQKTQVVTLPTDDVVSRRSHHVQSIASISETIALALGLNRDLVHAIAYGHDFGHAPFAHLGESVINDFIRDHDLGAVVRLPYQHELQSRWVVERVAKRDSGKPLNLTFEVVDGITCHCGEQFGAQRAVTPTLDRTWEQLDAMDRKGPPPATFEGAVMQVVDTVSYLGKDFLDGVRTGVVTPAEAPAESRATLGTTNAEIIDTLVSDLIVTSFDADAIQFSPEVHAAAFALYRFNYARIYLPRDDHWETGRNRQALRRVLAAFWSLTEAERGAPDSPAVGRRLLDDPTPALGKFLKHVHEFDGEYAALPPFRLALDYVQGMTDAYCLRVADELVDWDPAVGPGLFDEL